MNYNNYTKLELAEELTELNNEIIEKGGSLWSTKGDDCPARDVVKGNKLQTIASKWKKDTMIEDIKMALRVLESLQSDIVVETIEELEAEPMFETMPKFEDSIIGKELVNEMVEKAYQIVINHPMLNSESRSKFLDVLILDIINICNDKNWDRNIFIKIVSKIL